jgi:hypothetical protein
MENNSNYSRNLMNSLKKSRNTDMQLQENNTDNIVNVKNKSKVVRKHLSIYSKEGEVVSV